jgi:hypothetical protein
MPVKTKDINGSISDELRFSFFFLQIHFVSSVHSIILMFVILFTIYLLITMEFFFAEI